NVVHWKSRRPGVVGTPLAIRIVTKAAGVHSWHSPLRHDFGHRWMIASKPVCRTKSVVHFFQTEGPHASRYVPDGFQVFLRLGRRSHRGPPGRLEGVGRGRKHANAPQNT